MLRMYRGDSQVTEDSGFTGRKMSFFGLSTWILLGPGVRLAFHGYVAPALAGEGSGYAHEAGFQEIGGKPWIRAMTC